MTRSLRTRPAGPDDWPAIWGIMEPVIAQGDSYAWEYVTAEEARAVWLDADADVFVTDDGGAVVGTYLLKPNQPGRGSHVCNAAFMVAPAAQGRGVGRAMAEDALVRARAAGYSAMQFNLVVATNEPAVALWRQLGFGVVGRIPRGFRHSEHGLVDALIMYRDLEESP
jgi:ribosomal protein S18 acetylase RimI-like enzyme